LLSPPLTLYLSLPSLPSLFLYLFTPGDKRSFNLSELFKIVSDLELLETEWQVTEVHYCGALEGEKGERSRGRKNKERSRC
jgi:hypothetical protein